MGAENHNKSSWNSEEEIETRVILHVYDLTPVNNYTHLFGLGIFHSGIEVHGREYAFGAHDYPVSGVFEVEPKNCPGFVYRSSIPLGTTKLSPSEFRIFIEDVASEYHGDTYHLISRNCNHFTDDISQRLTDKPIPGWVNRLAHLGALCSCLLPESLQATTVRELPEYHECSDLEDDSESQATTTPRCSTEINDLEQDMRLVSPSAAGSGEVSFVKEAVKPSTQP